MLIKKKIIYKNKCKLIYQYLSTHFTYYENIKIYSEVKTKDLFLEYSYLSGNTLQLNDYKMYNKFKKTLIHNTNGIFETNKCDFEEYEEYFFINELNNYRKVIDIHINKDLDVKFKEVYPLLKSILNIYLKRNYWYENLKVAHGDLHCGNIICHEGNFYLIDFEEVCFAPKNFDLLIYIYRYYNYIAGRLTVEKYRDIKLEFSKNNLNVSDLCIYLIKVILQKKYLEYIYPNYYANNGNDRWIEWWKDLVYIMEDISNERENFNYSEAGLYRKRYCEPGC